MNEKSVAVYEAGKLSTVGGLPTPSDVVAAAAIQAKALMEVVEQKHLYIENEGKKFLVIEAWELINSFNNSGIATESVVPVYEGEKIVAYEARANIIKDGVIISSAVMSCGIDEFVTKGKTGYAKNVAAQSMAQTRAGSKTSRLKYAHVAILAGYQPTPAEEMQAAIMSQERDCPKHQGVTALLKDGQYGKYWSHKTKDPSCKKGYCNIKYEPSAETEEDDLPSTDDIDIPDKTVPTASDEANVTKPPVHIQATGFGETIRGLCEQLNWGKEEFNRFLKSNFKIEDSRAIKVAMRDEIIAKLQAMIKQIT